METPKEFYNCCNGDNLVGHKNTCIKPIMDKPAYHVWTDNDKDPSVMFFAIPIKEVADNAEKGYMTYLTGFFYDRWTEAKTLVTALYNRRMEQQSKILKPGQVRPPALRVH